VAVTQPVFRCPHQPLTVSLALMLRVYRQVVNPAAVPVVTNHDGAHEIGVDAQGEDVGTVPAVGEIEIQVRRVVMTHQATQCPELNDGCPIVMVGRGNGDGVTH
jgi:hypothetical protein